MISRDCGNPVTNLKPYLFACWVFFMLLLTSADFLQNLLFPKNSFRNTIRVSIDQSGLMFSGSKGLQRLLADDKSRL